ncbi:UNKNOWN [Stylonychia lemnae]|uniref:Amino acid transporter transmembrane domain-containing protein n=1 Tax=Stylonychia lemnae TaxID=5949 RepID=A0A078A355_STYLE|nr:UNKNOWN [Stylonychia lemnae]|eukprot:CDW76708.1 UNKNOWN [Stylonychia lemnae]
MYKQLAPQLLIQIFGHQYLPEFMQDNNHGKLLWGTVITFSINSLMLTMPLIFFGYMYQTNIPIIYKELQIRSERQMSSVMKLGTISGILVYTTVGIFGYLTFLNDPHHLNTKNILDAPYHNLAISIAKFGIFVVVLCAAPICILPAKDTIEEVVYKGRHLTKKQNILVTFYLVFVSYVLAMFIPSIGDALTLAGCTIGPFVGFIIPIIMYWKILENEKEKFYEKIYLVIIALVITTISIIALIVYIQEKTHD